MTAKEWGRLVQADRPLSFSCLRFVSCLLLNSPGWIYNTGPRQIGCTGRTPEIRAAELSKASAVPEPFVVAWAAAVTDHKAVESIVHFRLKRCRP